MSIFEHLLAKFSNPVPPKRGFQLDAGLIESLQVLAVCERRSEKEVVEDLLTVGLARRAAAEAYVKTWHQLTPREQQVVALTCLNFINKEIAVRLSIAPETVKTHVRSALHKFSVHNKADLRRLLVDWDFSDWK